MQQANDALQRYGMLHDNGSLPEVKWVEVQSKVAQAKSQLDIARKNLADCSLTAPVSGIIGKKPINAGETALPSQTVVTILDISKVKVKVSVPDTEISSIAENTPSSIRVDALDMEFEGGRIEKGVQADMLTRTYDIRINVQNPGGKLLPGMVASVNFNSQSQSGLLSVPVYAVQKRTDGSAFVWTIRGDSTAHRTNIKIGSVSGNDILIEDGLSEGSIIVTEGYQKLGEGTKVIY
jgi:RND family efflux transporter MFP subunit